MIFHTLSDDKLTVKIFLADDTWSYRKKEEALVVRTGWPAAGGSLFVYTLCYRKNRHEPTIFHICRDF